jgi:endoglucanase
MRRFWWLLLLLAVLAGGARAEPVTLSRGVNLTNWFRFPASRDPGALASYVSDQALADLRGTGFDFVRLAIDPAVAGNRSVLLGAIRRIQAQGLAVVISPHPPEWNLEADPEPLRRFWQSLAPALRGLDPARTVPEVLNEPVFAHDPAAWAALQHQVLLDIRRALPHATVVLTGQDWGSIGGLLALTPEADPDVVYSFHLYDPSELTSLAAYRPGVDRAAFARLPFPVIDPAACGAVADRAVDAGSRDLAHYYCTFGWDGGRIAATIDKASAWARAHGVRLLAGEFGATAELNAPARLAWLKFVRAGFEARGIGWALWGYDDVMGFGLSRPPPVRPVLDPSVLAALGLSTRM